MSDEMRISSTAMRHADAIVSAFSQRLYNDAFRHAERLGRTTVDIADVDAVADEIARLRLTDAEREAIESAIWDYEQNDDDEGCARMVSTLRGLLARCAIGHQ